MFMQLHVLIKTNITNKYTNNFNLSLIINTPGDLPNELKDAVLKMEQTWRNRAKNVNSVERAKPKLPIFHFCSFFFDLFDL